MEEVPRGASRSGVVSYPGVPSLGQDYLESLIHPVRGRAISQKPEVIAVEEPLGLQASRAGDV